MKMTPMRALLYALSFFFLLFGPCCSAFSQLPDPMVDGDPAFTVPPAGTRVYGQIPATRYDVYQLNNADWIDGLFDGDTTTDVHPGWGHVLNEQETWIQLRDYHAQITQLQLMNSYYHASPVKYYAVERGTWNRVYLGSSNGLPTHNWNRIPATPLTTPIEASYIIIEGELHFPKELRILGSYIQPAPAVTTPRAQAPFRNAIGCNFFEWDALEGDADPNDRYRIQENKMASLKIFKGGLRHYLDWERIETSRGVYEFNPSNSGGWNYDLVYQRLKAEGVPVLICLKQVPSWMQSSWPAGERDYENVPVFFKDSLAATIKSFEDPASYTDGGRMFFQLAARYGRNTAVDPALLSGVVTGRIWPGDPNSPVRTRESGLDLIEYLEVDNERDKWWKGRKAYQTGREYAAMMSAYYDGHKGTLGAGVGAKQADATMKIVIGGLALVRTDYIQGMIDWCRQYRGYKANGEVDLCFDILNYHQYANDAGSAQYGAGTRGKAPELTPVGEWIDRFLKFAAEKCYGREVWITESGYDVNQGSTQKAMAIGSKTGKDVQADWILRSSLLFSRKGIHRVMYYMFKDVWENAGGTFATSGFVESNSQLSARRPSADYLKQAGDLMGDYVYHSTVNADPVVDRYVLGDTSIYVAWIPDETGRTGSYTLTLPAPFTQIKRYNPEKGSDHMSTVIEPAPGGQYTIEATETPVFIKTVFAQTLPASPTGFRATYRPALADVRLDWSLPGAERGAFVVERSGAGGRVWDSVGTVPFAEKSEGREGYRFTDPRPLRGKSYYRLRWSDPAGNSGYSRTASVQIDPAGAAVVSPNPSAGVMSVALQNRREENAALQLRDSKGTVVWSRTVRVLPWTPVKVDLSSFPAGVYFLRIQTGAGAWTEKLTLE